jgi:hypothetical protein
LSKKKATNRVIELDYANKVEQSTLTSTRKPLSFKNKKDLPKAEMYVCPVWVTLSKATCLTCPICDFKEKFMKINGKLDLIFGLLLPKLKLFLTLCSRNHLNSTQVP